MKRTLLFLTLLLTACSSVTAIPTSAPTNIPKGSSKDIIWINNWLTSPSCNPPCWESIIPGKTTLDQAYKILISNPQVINVAQQTDYITWDFLLADKNGGGSGGVISANKDSIIEIISLTPQKSNIILDDIIKKFGEPDQVLFPATDSVSIDGTETPGAQISIVYLQYSTQNMVLALGIMSQDNETNITPNDEIWGIDFFTTGYDFRAFELTMILRRAKWVGYSSYK